MHVELLKPVHRVLPAAMIAAAALLFATLPAGCATDTDFKIPAETPEDYRKAMQAAVRGDALRKEQKWQDAAMAYRESLGYKNDIGAVWVNFGVCLVQLGDFVPARDAFLKAVDMLPNDPRPYENLGTLYHSRGYDAKAMDYFVESLARDPNYLPSLRGAVLTGKNLRTVSYAAQDRVDRAIIAEHDPDYLRMMQSERFRLAAALKAEAENKPQPEPQSEPAPESPRN